MKYTHKELMGYVRFISEELENISFQKKLVELMEKYVLEYLEKLEKREKKKGTGKLCSENNIF